MKIREGQRIKNLPINWPPDTQNVSKQEFPQNTASKYSLLYAMLGNRQNAEYGMTEWRNRNSTEWENAE